jgi:hypothetical protein
MYDDDDDNYGDEGYDYGDDEEENEQFEYDFEEEKQQYINFNYNDIGAEGRAGGVMDENLNIQILQTNYRKKLEPTEKFSLELLDLINTMKTKLKLSEADINTLKLNVAILPLIRWKSPLYYIVGYSIANDVPNPTNLSSKIKKIQPNIDVFTAIKYGKLWNQLLNKKNI